jgi:methylphosphotriester-DNA--protein-cysteine methyltransferase
VDKISQENRVELPSREAAVAAGYAACKNCKP